MLTLVMSLRVMTLIFNLSRGLHQLHSVYNVDMATRIFDSEKEKKKYKESICLSEVSVMLTSLSKRGKRHVDKFV